MKFFDGQVGFETDTSWHALVLQRHHVTSYKRPGRQSPDLGSLCVGARSADTPYLPRPVTCANARGALRERQHSRQFLQIEEIPVILPIIRQADAPIWPNQEIGGHASEFSVKPSHISAP